MKLGSSKLEGHLKNTSKLAEYLVFSKHLSNENSIRPESQLGSSMLEMIRGKHY